MIKFSDFAVDVNGFVIYIQNIQVSVIRDKKEKDASVKIFDLITNENQTEKYCCYMNHYDEVNKVLRSVSSETLIGILSRIEEFTDWFDIKDESYFSFDVEYITELIKICELEETEYTSKLLDWYRKVKQFETIDISILDSSKFYELTEFLDELEDEVMNWLYVHQDQWYNETIKVEDDEEYYEVRIKRKSDNFLLYTEICFEENECKQFLDYVVGNIGIDSI